MSGVNSPAISARPWWRSRWVWIGLGLLLCLHLSAIPLLQSARGTGRATVTFQVFQSDEFPLQHANPDQIAIVELLTGEVLVEASPDESHSTELTCEIFTGFSKGPLVDRQSFPPDRYGVRLTYGTLTVEWPLKALLERDDFWLNDDRIINVPVPGTRITKAVGSDR
ncbi:hypothetical protein Pan189_34870 [Stratiformator vulcanicus]|uniref:Uncharacterized protein n=1 Tax=Stratiformator vulcanicus TaxID=2527980 RepID=A0A517R5H3_9PLAN|nr:hypothetical protein Pan189_34870 [Stratiformator vulcanicus]